jgi:hypothetical protein
VRVEADNFGGHSSLRIGEDKLAQGLGGTSAGWGKAGDDVEKLHRKRGWG